MKSGLAFPAGAAGVGLLLLRASVGASLLLFLSGPGAPALLQGIGILAAVGVYAGLWTRVFAALSVAAAIHGMVAGTAPPTLVMLHLANAAALALVGPGAFSIDARLFGRRTITLPDRGDSIE